MTKKALLIGIMLLFTLSIIGCKSNTGQKPAVKKMNKINNQESTNELRRLREVNKNKLDIEAAVTLKLSDYEKSLALRTGDDEIYLPIKLAVDQNGSIFALRISDKGLMIYNAQGELEKTLKVSRIDPQDIAVNRLGDKIFLIDHDANKLLVVDRKGEELYFGSPPYLFEGSDLKTMNKTFAIDEDTIAFVGYYWHGLSLAFNLMEKQWKKIKRFDEYGLDSKFYLLDQHKVTSWTDINDPKNVTVIKNNNLFPEGIGGIFGINSQGLIFQTVDTANTVTAKKYPSCNVFIYDPSANKEANLELPYGEFCLGYDDRIYVYSSPTKRYNPAELSIYRIGFGSNFLMKKIAPPPAMP